MSKKKSTQSAPILEKSIEQIGKEAANEENADIFLYNGPINDKGFARILKGLSLDEKADNAILLLTTFGGSAHAAYRIAKWFQRYYKTFSVFPTSICGSAGTLIAIGAHRLIMSPFSELGPLDIQKFVKDELGERQSGLVTQVAIESLQNHVFDFFQHVMLNIKARSYGSITFEKSSTIATELTSSLFREIFRQIDPSILGKNSMDLNIATEYGKRLAAEGQNIDIDKIRTIVHGYPSHDFVIDLEEATELFNRVELPSSTLTLLMVALKHRAAQTDSSSLDVVRLASYRSKCGVEGNHENEPKGHESERSSESV